MSGRATILGILLCVGLTLAAGACGTVPTPDPDHGVSNSSYREALTQIGVDISQVVSKLLLLKAADLGLNPDGTAIVGARAIGPHSAAWWDAEIMEARQAQKLAEGTLKGAGK